MTKLEDIKKLRVDTGAGMMDCKKALAECNGDMESAKVYLVKNNIVKRGNKGHRVASEGIIGTYLHTGGRICSIVEVNCETDFVARGGDFQNFAHDLAMHIAALNPKWINREDVPVEAIEKEKKFLNKGLENKPADIVKKILDGRLNKFFKESCLMEQPFIKDSKLTIQDLYDNLSVKIGERIVIKRLARFEVGE